MAVICICAISVSAQIEKGFRNGIRVNVGMSKYDYGDAAVGYGIGWVAEYNFSPNLFLQSGIGFEDITYKSIDYRNLGGDGYITHYKTHHVLYAQIPVHLGYRFVLGNSSSLFVHAGPYIGYGIVASKDSGHDHFDYGPDRFDFGFGGRVGIELSKFQISAGINHGVIDPYNLSVNLGLVYFF